LHCAHDELAVGDLVKLSRRHDHAAKLKRENQTEKQFFTFDCALPTARIPSVSRGIPMRCVQAFMARSLDLRSG